MFLRCSDKGYLRLSGKDIPEITVVSSVVATHEMTKCGFSVTPGVALAQNLGSIKRSNLLSKLVVSLRNVHVLDRFVILGLVNSHIEDSKVELSQVEQGCVDMLRLDEVLDQFIWDLGCGVWLIPRVLLPSLEILWRNGGVVSAKGLELRRGPAPVLEHLAGSLYEITDSVGAVEARVDGLGDKIVDSVTKLVEEGDDFVVLEQTGLLLGWLGEVADQCGSRVSTRSILFDEALQAELMILIYYGDFGCENEHTGCRLKLAA